MDPKFSRSCLTYLPGVAIGQPQSVHVHMLTRLGRSHHALCAALHRVLYQHMDHADAWRCEASDAPFCRYPILRAQSSVVRTCHAGLLCSPKPSFHRG